MLGLLNKEGRPADEAAPSAPPTLHPFFESPLLPVFGSLLSGVLLALSFPGYGNSSLAFMGLVPLLFAVQSASGRKAALLGLLSGFVFFMGSLHWLHNLTGTVSGFGLKASALLGYAVLALYCALYFIPASVTLALCCRRWGVRSWRTNLRMMFSVTMVWTGSEYLRSFLFTGFPWNPLGVSQYANPVLIQVAEWGGVYMVSACLVWMNTAIFITLRQYTHGLRLKKYRPHAELMLGMLPVALSAAYGLNTLFNRPTLYETVRVALVQPNIPQTEKWDEQKNQDILDRLEELTGTVTRLEGLDLIIWPETALPDFVRISRSSQALVKRMAGQGVPLLVGSMDVVFSESSRTYYNSSMLFGTNGVELAKYDKQHLVPFGEYVPFPNLMRKFTPIDVDFGGGTQSTLFPLRGKASFSALICFEDTVAPLAVKAVRSGARWLVNQTNDAWFDPSAQSEQHLAHAVFRCIENRVPMARCCNTGVTCIIDAYGHVQRTLDVRIKGFTTGELQPRPVGMEKTFYTRNGDAFAKFSLLAGATVIFVLRSKGWKRRRKAGETDQDG
jgi:apolipoprotein N-acyltransferase